LFDGCSMSICDGNAPSQTPRGKSQLTFVSPIHALHSTGYFTGKQDCSVKRRIANVRKQGWCGSEPGIPQKSTNWTQGLYSGRLTGSSRFCTESSRTSLVLGASEKLPVLNGLEIKSIDCTLQAGLGSSCNAYRMHFKRPSHPVTNGNFPVQYAVINLILLSSVSI
jgi:hypothetical protein